jgi:hypothetical protein
MLARLLCTAMVILVLGPGGLTALAKQQACSKGSERTAFTKKADPQAGEKAAEAADPNLVGCWTFDESSGTTAADSSKYRRDGTLNGELSFDENSVEGRMGKALSVDGGADRYVEIKGYKGVVGTRPRTVAAWIKTKHSGGAIALWGLKDFGKMWKFGFVRGHIGITPHGGYYYIKDNMNDGQWHHVAVTVAEADPPSLNENVTVFTDGEVAEIHDIGLLGLWPVDTESAMDVKIGSGFNGALDDVRIYDRALSTEQVRALYEEAEKQTEPAAQ